MELIDRAYYWVKVGDDEEVAQFFKASNAWSLIGIEEPCPVEDHPVVAGPLHVPVGDGAYGIFEVDKRMTKPMKGETHISLQWKGTHACMDINCKCGHHSHLDDYFAYYVKCGGCGQIYSLNEYIEAIPLTPEEIQKLAAGDRSNLVRTPEDVDLERAKIESLRAVMEVGGTLESKVEVDKDDPTLAHLLMIAHPPPGYEVLVVKTKDLPEKK
jgi:hypothetical protein